MADAVDPKYMEALASMHARDLTREYLRWRGQFRSAIKMAVKVSRGSGGIPAKGNRDGYASILFTRITVMAKSINQLLPDCRPREHWDFGAIAVLYRSLIEAYLWYFWLCEDEVDEDVRQGRFILTYCHDYGTRHRIAKGDTAPESDDLTIADLTKRFDANPYLKTFDQKSRREALKGHKTPFVQDEVLERMGIDKAQFRTQYRLFSQYTHNTPIAFLTLFEDDRGKGVETALEKRSIIPVLMLAWSLLESATDGHLTIFPDAEKRKPHLTDQEIIRNVERNQGREKKGRSR